MRGQKFSLLHTAVKVAKSDAPVFLRISRVYCNTRQRLSCLAGLSGASSSLPSYTLGGNPGPSGYHDEPIGFTALGIDKTNGHDTLNAIATLMW
jgi:hypothetical protein